jgi:hypothetical protein
MNKDGEYEIGGTSGHYGEQSEIDAAILRTALKIKNEVTR